MPNNINSKTRKVIWKEYRDNISNNNMLSEALFNSNEKLSLLYNRLIKAYPEYEKKHKTNEVEKTQLEFKEITEAEIYDLENILKFLDEITFLEENTNGSIGFLNNLDFSSKQLDSVIQDINIGKNSQIEYVSMLNDNIATIQLQKVILTKAVKNEKN